MRKCTEPKVGLLLIATARFTSLGTALDEGGYEVRKNGEASRYVDAIRRFGEVVCPGIIYTENELCNAIDLFSVQKVDCVLALFLSWAEDFAWVRFLRDMPPIPVFFASVVRDGISFKNTEKETDFVEFLSAGGLVGTLEASGSVKRFNRPMLVSAIGSFDEILKKADDFAKAAAARTALRNTGFGLLASYNEVMWSTYVDPYNLFMKVGPELHFLSVISLLKEIEALPDKLVEETCHTLRSRYATTDDVDADKFVASVRASLGLEALARKAQVSMVVLNDVDPVLLTHVGLRPGFLPCPGTDDVIVVPEGDIGGGLAVYILRMLTGEKVNFAEPFHIDKENNCFAAGHAGPNDYTDPCGQVKIACDVRFAKTSYKYAGAPFAWYTIPPGIKTMLHISECNGRFKMACTLVEALPCEHFITSYSHGLFRPVSGSCEQLFDSLIQLGVTQHYGIAPGNCIAKLAYLAQIMDFDFTEL